MSLEDVASQMCTCHVLHQVTIVCIPKAMHAGRTLSWMTIVCRHKAMRTSNARHYLTMVYSTRPMQVVHPLGRLINVEAIFNEGRQHWISSNRYVQPWGDAGRPRQIFSWCMMDINNAVRKCSTSICWCVQATYDNGRTRLTLQNKCVQATAEAGSLHVTPTSYYVQAKGDAGR